MLRSILIISALVTLDGACLWEDDAEKPPNLLAGDFESGIATYNPWTGVDNEGNLRVNAGSQLAVDNDGDVQKIPFSPSIAVGDFNGDGLPDLVVADARGFFWFFPNSGKPNAPVFTHGEIMPIWLGGVEAEGDSVPRIQLVDFTGEKKRSIVAGKFLGGLYLYSQLRLCDLTPISHARESH